MVGLAAAAVLLAALTLTYSQTSFAALAVGLGLLVWFRFGMRGFALAAALGAVAACFVLVVGGPSADESIDKDRTDLAETSSGRTNLISGGIDLFQDAPIAGQGSGSFATAYRREVDKVRKPVSHTEPITVAAEQGIIGLIPYFAVLALAARRPLPALAFAEQRRARGCRGRIRGALRALARLRGLCDRPGDVGAARAGSRAAGVMTTPTGTCCFRT